MSDDIIEDARIRSLRKLGFALLCITLISIPVCALIAVETSLPFWSAGVFALIICLALIVSALLLSWDICKRIVRFLMAQKNARFPRA